MTLNDSIKDDELTKSINTIVCFLWIKEYYPHQKIPLLVLDNYQKYISILTYIKNYSS